MGGELNAHRFRRLSLAVLSVALLGCGKNGPDEPIDTVVIAMPDPHASVEEIVALAEAYTSATYGGSGPFWLHHVRVPAVNRVGVVVVGEDPIEIVFTMRRFHGPMCASSCS